MGAKVDVIVLQTKKSAKIIKWKVKEGNLISVGRVILIYEFESTEEKKEQSKLKATQVGTVKKILAQENEIIHPGLVISHSLFLFIYSNKTLTFSFNEIF